MKTTISKWGKSLGIRLPAETVRDLNLFSGEKLLVEVKDSSIFLKPANEKRVMTEREFKKMLAKGPRKINTKDFFDEMKPRGKEIW